MVKISERKKVYLIINMKIMKKTIFALSLLSSVFVFSQEKNNKPQEKQIEGVVITKTKKAVEQKADRTIFDFSEQPQLNNGNVLEGIKKLFFRFSMLGCCF